MDPPQLKLTTTYLPTRRPLSPSNRNTLAGQQPAAVEHQGVDKQNNDAKSTYQSSGTASPSWPRQGNRSVSVPTPPPTPSWLQADGLKARAPAPIDHFYKAAAEKLKIILQQKAACGVHIMGVCPLPDPEQNSAHGVHLAVTLKRQERGASEKLFAKYVPNLNWQPKAASSHEPSRRSNAQLLRLEAEMLTAAASINRAAELREYNAEHDYILQTFVNLTHPSADVAATLQWQGQLAKCAAQIHMLEVNLPSELRQTKECPRIVPESFNEAASQGLISQYAATLAHNYVNTLQRAREALPQPPFLLIHGDLRRENVLQDADGKIMYVTGFKHAVLSDPMAELAFFLTQTFDADQLKNVILDYAAVNHKIGEFPYTRLCVHLALLQTQHLDAALHAEKGILGPRTEASFTAMQVSLQLFQDDPKGVSYHGDLNPILRQARKDLNSLIFEIRMPISSLTNEDALPRTNTDEDAPLRLHRVIKILLNNYKEESSERVKDARRWSLEPITYNESFDHYRLQSIGGDAGQDVDLSIKIDKKTSQAASATDELHLAQWPKTHEAGPKVYHIPGVQGAVVTDYCEESLHADGGDHY